MKKKFITIILMLMLIPFVNAAEDILGGVGQDILSTAVNIVNYPITFPAAKLYGYESQSISAPLWAFVFVFMILFSLFWLASGQIPLFKNEENSGPRKAFVIAFSFLLMLGTPITKHIFNMTKIFGAFIYIAMLIVGVYTIWVLSKGSWAANRIESAKASQNLANAAQSFADAERQIKQTKEYKHKTALAAKKGLKNQISAIRSLRSDLENVLTQLRRFQRGSGTTILGNQRTNKIIKDLDRVRSDLGKLITFTTENDKLLTGMTNLNYNEMRNPPNLGVRNDETINIRRHIDTQTNDLGRMIGGIADIIRTQGIILGPNGNIQHLIDVTLNAINILERMERDIVLEEQMVEKI